MTLSQLTTKVRAVLHDVSTLRIRSSGYLGCCEIQLADEVAADAAMARLQEAGLPSKKIASFNTLGYWTVGAARPEDYPQGV